MFCTYPVLFLTIAIFSSVPVALFLTLASETYNQEHGTVSAGSNFMNKNNSKKDIINMSAAVETFRKLDVL